MVRGLSGCPAWTSQSPGCLTGCSSPPAPRALRTPGRDLDSAAAAGSRPSSSSAASTSTAYESAEPRLAGSSSPMRAAQAKAGVAFRNEIDAQLGPGSSRTRADHDQLHREYVSG
jgi:hypothetical protein